MKQAPIILFDGVCHLCQASVRFVIQRDPPGRFRFAPLQSDLGRRLLAGHGLQSSRLDSIVLIADGKAYGRSTAALRIARQLRGAWPLLFALIAIPRPVRDAIYDFIGSRRYRWFGRSDACWIAPDSMRDRFLA